MEKIESVWKMIELGTKKKGAEKRFHYFTLTLWKEINDIEREVDMEAGR